MSLVRLLTTGKSLVGGADELSRYHVSSQRLLPKFAPKRNPFRATTRPECAQAAAGAPAATEPAPARTVEVRPGKDPASKAQPDQSKLPQGKPASAGWFRRWLAKANAWFQARPAKPAKPAIPRFTKSPVQGELSLDSVKVVRNDLSESDLEVVPAKGPATAPIPAPATPAAEPAEPAVAPRSAASPRLFAAGKTLS